jgi:hypothetical protein
MTRKKQPAAAPTRINLPHGLVAHVILRNQLDLLLPDDAKLDKDADQ